jgi:hypothetical protein
MDPDYKRLLELSEENNKMLHKLMGDLRWRKFWAIVRWSLIIGSTIGLYYWLQPFLDQILNAYQSLPQLFGR